MTFYSRGSSGVERLPEEQGVGGANPSHGTRVCGETGSTRYLEVVVPKGVGIRIPPDPPVALE